MTRDVNRCLPRFVLARVVSGSKKYEPASAAVLASGSSAHLERGGKDCEWAFAVCFGRMNKRGHLVGKQSRLHRAYLASIVGNRRQLVLIESRVRKSAHVGNAPSGRGCREGLFFNFPRMDGAWSSATGQ